MTSTQNSSVVEQAALTAKLCPVRWDGLKLIHEHIARIGRANVEMAKLLWKHRPYASSARLILLGFMIGTPFLASWASGQVIAGVVNHADLTLWDPAALALALSLVVTGALPLIMSVLDRLIEHWAFVHVQQAQVTKVPDLDPVTYSDPDLKDKIQQVQERAVWRIMAFVKSQLMLARAIALAIIAGGMLAKFNPWLCLIIVSAMIPSMGLEGLHAYRQFKVDERQGDWWRRFWEDRGNILGSKTLAYLQVFGAAHWFAQRFSGQIANAMDEYDVVERRSVLGRITCMTIGMSAIVLVAMVLVGSVSRGGLSVANFVFDLGALSLFGASLAEIASSLGQQLGQSLYVSSFQEVLALESRTHFPQVGQQPSLTPAGVPLELSNVRFGYPQGAGKTQREVIKGVSLSVPAGEKWAIVGINGAGKSTLKALLVRLFDPDVGEIRIGGIRACDMDRATLRKLIGCLPQDIQHYNLTVEEFITLGCSGEVQDAERIRWAAKRSGAAPFIELYPQKYGQRLGRDYKDAEEPSGGQLQKLALASLLYMKAALMVLDEPTAAIDPESARDFWDTLFHETPGQTVIFSTHYLGAVRRANRIVVLDQGQILDQGTHRELMERCETYRKLFESQARDYQS